MLAIVIGVRPNAIAIDVPSVTRSVTSAAWSSCRNGSCCVSPVHSPAYPAASLAAADAAHVVEPAEVGVDQHLSSVQSRSTSDTRNNSSSPELNPWESM